MPSSQPAATDNIFDLIDQIADTVNKMLNEKQKEHYLGGILMLYSSLSKSCWFCWCTSRLYGISQTGY